MIVSAFVSPRKFAGLAACALAVALTACGGSSPNNATQNVPVAPSAPTPPGPASAPAQNPSSVAESQPSMSVAELTAPTNAPASSAASSGNPPANTTRTNPPAALPPQSGALPSASYAPHAGGAPPSVAPSERAGSGDYAQVISVTPLNGAQQVCSDETVTERRPPSDNHQVAGTVIGAIAGGVIGNRFGRGSGRKLTTVAGAVGGGIAGKKIQEAHQDNDMTTRVVKRCHTVTPGHGSPPLYEVVYAYQGQNLHVKLDYDPGSRIALPVRGVQ